MGEPVIVVDSSQIRAGKLDELKAAIGDLVRFVESHEPRVLSYSVYLDDDETRMTVVQVHPDSRSAELHMEVAGPAFGRFTELVELQTMDVYGDASESLRDRLHRKAQMLGGARVAVHDGLAGFARPANE